AKHDRAGGGARNDGQYTRSASDPGISGCSSRPSALPQPAATGAAVVSGTASAVGKPIENRSPVTARAATSRLTNRPSTVPAAHSTAAPRASSAGTACDTWMSSGFGNASNQAPVIAGTANQK